MKRNDILKALENFVVNSGVDTESKLFKEAVNALLAISLKQIED